MLDEFIASNREAILARARQRVASRRAPSATDREITEGIPLFLDQLSEALRLARANERTDHEDLGRTAGRHGKALFDLGLSIGQVVHDYGDICQSVTALAVALDAPITGDEFQLLNLCLDEAIAGAVSEWASQREISIENRGTERLGVLAHELRNALASGVIAYQALLKGHVAIGGSTGQVLGRSLLGLGALIDRSLADVRLDAGIEFVEEFSVATFLDEIEVSATLIAAARQIALVVAPLTSAATLEGDRQILAGALTNMLQNAFKFTPRGGTVFLTTRITNERVLFEVEDECGGLPPGKIEELFAPFSQRGHDRSGAGLGLAICMKAAHANGGQMSVRDVPGKGCVFTLNLPRKRTSSVVPPAPVAAD